jgi:hypothetical protein
MDPFLIRKGSTMGARATCVRVGTHNKTCLTKYTLHHLLLRLLQKLSFDQTRDFLPCLSRFLSRSQLLEEAEAAEGAAAIEIEMLARRVGSRLSRLRVRKTLAQCQCGKK